MTSFTSQACVQLAAELRRKPTPPLQRTKQGVHLGQATLSLMTPAQHPLLQRQICRCAKHVTEPIEVSAKLLSNVSFCLDCNASVLSNFKSGCRILPSHFTSVMRFLQMDGSNSDEAGDNENRMLADSESDHSSAAQEKDVKRSKDRASESRHSSRDWSLARSTRAVKPVAETKAVEGRKRLRKAS